MADKPEKDGPKPVKYSQLIEETASRTGNIPGRVQEITDVFIEALLNSLAEGSKIRLGQFGVMRGRKSETNPDSMSIKFNRSVANPDELVAKPDDKN